MKQKSNSKYKKFIELLEFSNGKYHTTDVFRDFVIMFAIAIKNSFAYDQDDENIYLHIINTYDKTELGIFAKLIVELMNIISETDEIEDNLGEIFATINANSKITGQFFTPANIAELMIKLSLWKRNFNDEEFEVLYEPTCGSGIMILSWANYIKSKKIDYRKTIFAECQDIDFICFCMCYIQLSLYNIPGRVILGDTLSDEKRKVFYTPEFFIGKWKEKIEEGETKNERE